MDFRTSVDIVPCRTGLIARTSIFSGLVMEVRFIVSANNPSELVETII